MAFVVASFIFLVLSLVSPFTTAATFNILNNCSYVVWAATYPGGGRALDPAQSWSVDVAAGTKLARIWGRTNCTFDASGKGSCSTGDCNGVLDCQDFGSPPYTMGQYALNQGDKDYYVISLVDGFNIPMYFSPVSGGCQSIKCADMSIMDQCPAALQAQGGCRNACTVFKTSEYCCTDGPCSATTYSQFFQQRCPDAYDYAQEGSGKVFTCPSGNNYQVTFCP